MQYWKIVEAGDYKVYGQKILELHRKKPEFFRHINLFWNPVKTDRLKEVLDNIPEFQGVIEKFGPIKQMAVLTLGTDSSTLHIDHTDDLNNGVQARLNIPLLNCEGSSTAFFEMDEKTFQMHESTPSGAKYWPTSLRNSLEPITEIELIQPTILRTSSPHTIFCRTCQYPRISLTISFVNDVVNFL